MSDLQRSGASKPLIFVFQSCHADVSQGNVFSSTFCPDDPTTIAIAGSKGKLQIWETASNAGVRKAFGEQLKALGKNITVTAGDGLVGLADGSDDESDGDD